MPQHHSSVHGVPRPNRECKGCGSKFYDSKSRRSFCDDCNPNAGENNGNWKDAKETTDCRTCGSAFEYYPSDKQGIYCPDCVESAAGLLPENPVEKHPREDVECSNCGAELQVLPSRVSAQKRGVFCDPQCYGDWLSDNIVGEDHHQWKGVCSRMVRVGGGSAGSRWSGMATAASIATSPRSSWIAKRTFTT